MGYTHYVKRHLTYANNDYLFDAYRDIVHKLILQAQQDGIQVADPAGEILGNYELSKDTIAFNGYKEHAHETFVWERTVMEQNPYASEADWYFDFCKTARKDYDTLVVACLVALGRVYGKTVIVTSDGDHEDLEAGRDLYHRAIDYPKLLAVK